MESDDRIGIPAICSEFVRQTGKPPPVSTTQLRCWLSDAVLNELDPVRSPTNGRWTVRRSLIPLLADLAPKLEAQRDARMRHSHLQVAEITA